MTDFNTIISGIEFVAGTMLYIDRRNVPMPKPAAWLGIFGMVDGAIGLLTGKRGLFGLIYQPSVARIGDDGPIAQPLPPLAQIPYTAAPSFPKPKASSLPAPWSTLVPEVWRRVEAPLDAAFKNMGIPDPGNPLKGAFPRALAARTVIELITASLREFPALEPGIQQVLLATSGHLAAGRYTAAQGLDILESTLTYALTDDPQQPGVPRLMIEPVTTPEDLLAHLSLHEADADVAESHRAALTALADRFQAMFNVNSQQWEVPPAFFIAAREYMFRVMAAQTLQRMIG